ncbi:PREDICTED: putative Polycomb group protein ASXL3 [Nanorana parkeri]|uniref:putative Polycomb group protein ASXL3 n=1 Tax=Nanorana parkeri TaxID=125878 RepID=UPI00085487DD|nr:PREDICTED: putative Polycomb group protein ASXL3 [Nanorana parkeri]
MKDKRKKKDRTWAEAARLALEKHPNSPMTAKQILEVIQKEGLKETRNGTSPLACLNAMLHTNTRVGDGTFFKIPGKSGLYALKKEESSCPADGTLEIGCESELDGTEMAEASSNGEENEVCLKQVTEEASSNRVQSKLVSSFQQHTKKALKQALRQQQKRRNGVSMMVNKTVPRVVLTPLKVSDEQSDSPSGSESKNGEADSSDKETKQGQKSPPGKQISQHLKRLKKSGLGHLKWTKAEDIDIETPGSILVNTNLRALINKHTFASLPQHFQQYLLLLLPEVDRQMGSDGALRLSNSALNNEFFAYAAQGWKQRLSEGEFTPEMQMRIRQEIEKEKKTEVWKEKFFEKFYGEKSGMSKEESLQLTSVQNSSEDESSSLETSLNLPGPSTQFENSAPASNETPVVLETEVVEETVCNIVCNMDQVSSKVMMGEGELEDILISEESLIHEEIAEEVETTICECHEDVDKDEVELTEDITNQDSKNEDKEEPTENVESCVVMEDEVVPHSESKTEEEVKSDSEQGAPLEVVSDIIDCRSPTPSLSSHGSPGEPTEQDAPQVEDLHASEDNGAFSATADSACIEETVAVEMELISEPEEQFSEAACVSETSFSSQSPEGACVSVASPGGDTQSASEEPYTPASVEAAFLSEVSSFENAESESQQKTTAESPPTSVASDVSPLSTSPVLSEASPPSDHPLTPEPSPASNLPLTSEASPMSDVPLISETSSVSSVALASETGHTNLPATSDASSVYSPPPNDHLLLQQTSSPTSSDESRSPSKDETDAYSEASQADTIGTEQDSSENLKYNSETPNSDTSLSEDALNQKHYKSEADQEKQSVSSAAELSPPDTITIKNSSSHYRIVDKKNVSPSQDGLDGIHSRNNQSVHTKSHEKPYSTSAEVVGYYESSRSKSYKQQVGSQSRVDSSHCKSYEYNKQSETISREPEISKRKTAELHSFGNYKEKRPRIDDDHPRSSSNSSQSDREHPPREEPRVPPLKIQLSKSGPPFIIKSQPAPRLESKISSNTSVSGGRNTGARTLADIKARAQQARAQREAAAAAAVAAAASIVSGGVGSPSETSKTRTLAHIKEQTKVKLFSKHQVRAGAQQSCRDGKSKEGISGAEASSPPDAKVEGSTGVIIMNPNCKSPSSKPSLHRELTSMLQKSLSSSTSSETDSDVSLHGSTENIHVPHSSDKAVTSTSTEDCSVPMNYSKNIGSVSVCTSADAPFTNALDMSVDNENTTSPACNLNMIKPMKENDIPFITVTPKCTDDNNSHASIVSDSVDDKRVPVSNNNVHPYTTVPVSSIGSSLPNPHLTNSLSSLSSSVGSSSRHSDKLAAAICEEDVCSSVRRMSNHVETMLESQGRSSVPLYPNSRRTLSSDPSLAKLHLDKLHNSSCSNLAGLNSKTLPSGLMQTNRSIPCKVIVDHCTTPNSTYPFSTENVEITDSQSRIGKTDLSIQSKTCPQVSVISRQENLINESAEHLLSSNIAARLKQDDRNKPPASTSLLETSYMQQEKLSDLVPCQQNFNEQLHSTLSYKCGTDNMTNSEYIPNNRICWSDKEQMNNDKVVINHLGKQKHMEYCEENIVDNIKSEPGSYSHVSKIHTRSPVNSISIKSETVDSSKCFGMETEVFSGHNTTPQTADLDLGLPSSKTPIGVSREEPLSLTTDGLKRVTNAANTSCRLSSVEANNPLVTQLLQGNLPLEKVLPQPRLGAKLEISRLPLQSTSVYKISSERLTSENSSCSPTLDSKGYPMGSLNPLQIRKRENHPKKRMARTMGEHAQIKCESGKLSMDADANLSSCMMSSNVNSVGQEQAFKQEWMNKHAVTARIVHSPEIKQQKRPLPSCSFQQSLFNADKNGSYHAESSALHRQHYYQMSMAQRGSGPNVYVPSSGSAKAQSSNNAFAFSRQPEQKVLAEANVPSLPFRMGNAYSPNVHIKEGDDLSNAPQTLQNKFLVHPSLSNSEVPSDQKQPAVTMETTKRLSWPQPASICSNIKSEPISFEDGLHNSCELTMKQSSYEQSEVKEQLKAFALKNADFSSYLLSEPQKPFSQLAAQKTQTQQLPQQQQCGSYPAIHFGSTSFKRAASAIEKSIGILGNNSKPVSGLSSQNTPIPAQKFADSSSADELELKCSCRLKAMIVCKGCGAFCHDDCIGPSKLCVACLVVR